MSTKTGHLFHETHYSWELFSTCRMSGNVSKTIYGGKPPVPNWQPEQEQEIALFAAWNQRRYIRSGIERNDMTFELFGNTDSLLESLGLSSHREGLY